MIGKDDSSVVSITLFLYKLVENFSTETGKASAKCSSLEEVAGDVKSGIQCSSSPTTGILLVHYRLLNYVHVVDGHESMDDKLYFRRKN